MRDRTGSRTIAAMVAWIRWNAPVMRIHHRRLPILPPSAFRRVSLSTRERRGLRSYAFEEPHDAGLERVLRAHHEEPILRDQTFEQGGPMPQMIHGSADVRPHR